MQSDIATADAFATSWNHIGVVYTREQFAEWFEPLAEEDIRGKTVIELGFGNGSLLCHVAASAPSRLVGIELGDTFEQAGRNLALVAPGFTADLRRGDLTEVRAGEFDLAYCIGVLHHLDDPSAGFSAVLRHTKPGGRFHCWVYAREGNAFTRMIVEPVRKIASRLPWWLTKYLIALPMVLPYFFLAKALRAFGLLKEGSPVHWLPLFHYTQWISGEPFRFFHHVAFDQLVTPRTRYIARDQVERWLAEPDVEPDSTYIIFRNHNSWKFGGRRRA